MTAYLVPLLRKGLSVSPWIKLSILIIQLIILSCLCQAFQRPSNQASQSDALFDQPLLPVVAGNQQQQQQAQFDGGQHFLQDKLRIQDREHIKEHLGGIINEPDLNKMSEEEAQFYYFKSHDSDHNNKLDGSELIKSIIHWHVEEHKHLGQNAPTGGTTKIFTDAELAAMIDPILLSDDRNRDGYIDYPEFVAAQKSRAAKPVI